MKKTFYAIALATLLTACNSNSREIPEDAITLDVEGTELVMVKIYNGDFMMGATSEQKDCSNFSELPAHKVKLTKPFYMSQTEVTQELWTAVMGTDPSAYKNEKETELPVHNVSWFQCQEFVKKLSQKTGKTFRLPTEAEWEFAARGAGKGYNLQYAGSKFCDRVSCMKTNSNGHPHPVAQYGANEAGLYDMGGNVWEWVADNYTDYKDSLYTDPLITTTDTLPHSVRGGSWNDKASNCRTSTRMPIDPKQQSAMIGFRIVMTE